MRIFTTIALCGAAMLFTAANAQTANFFDYASLSSPATTSVELNYTFEGAGMSVITMAAADNLDINPACTGSATLEYSETEGGVKTLVKAIPVVFPEDGGDGTGVMVMSVAAGAEGDDDVIEIPKNNTIYFAFVTVADLARSSVTAPFKKSGFYTLTFPEGSFLLKNADETTTLLSGESVKYELTVPAQEDKDFSYTIDPANNTDITDMIKDNKFEWTITFPGGKNVFYATSAGATMTNGKNVVSNGFPKIEGNKLTFTFGNKNTQWDNGTWEVKIPKGNLFMDMPPYGDYMNGDGNVPEISGIFYIVNKSGQSGVAVVGLEKADSYTVVSLDGKVVAKDAALEDLGNLAPAIYIINGKKVSIK